MPKSLKLHPALQSYVSGLSTEFELIPPARKELLRSISKYIEEKLKQSGSVQCIFICTHNSRRSHLAQLWAGVATRYYGFSGSDILTYSGGTEVTAFNPRAVDALRRAGFEIETLGNTGTVENPHYSISFSPQEPGFLCYSKTYDAPENPSSNFVALMTCSEADEACPIVVGCDQRYALTYLDPKEADGAPEESKVYDERCRQIAREMFYLMAGV
jgi:arsenate reductase